MTASALQVHQRQRAPLRHGLYARSGPNVRIRNYRTGRLLSRLQELLNLPETSLATARGWCQLEILSSDMFATLQLRGMTAPSGEPSRLLAEFRQLRAIQLTYARELGLTPSADLALRREASSLLSAHRVEELQADLRRRYAEPVGLQGGEENGER